MLSDDIAVANAEYIAYASPLDNVISNEDYIECMLDWNDEAIDILYNRKAEVKTMYYENLDKETLTLQNSLWETLKIENAVEKWIYFTSGGILLLLLGIWLYNYILKKIRNNY